MNFRRITADETLAIRHHVLWPNKPVSFCKVADDETGNHYGVFIDEQLVSVASIYIEGDSARLRKFATLTEHQKKGIGKGLILHILSHLKAQKIKHFWCDARTTATGFYQKLGMKTEGDEFDKSGVAYFKMSMDLFDSKTSQKRAL